VYKRLQNAVTWTDITAEIPTKFCRKTKTQSTLPELRTKGEVCYLIVTVSNDEPRYVTTEMSNCVLIIIYFYMFILIFVLFTMLTLVIQLVELLRPVHNRTWTWTADHVQFTSV